MKIKFLIIYITAAFGIIHAQDIPQQLDVKSAVKITVERNPAVTQALKQVDITEARIKQQKTNYLPDVEADASYVRVSPVAQFSFGSLSAELNPANNYDAHVSAKYNLLDFGKKDAQLDVISSYKQAAKDNIDFVKNGLAYQTVQTFYSVLFLQKSIDVKDEQIQNMDNHLNTINLKIKTETATGYDVLATNTRKSSVQNQKIDIQNDLEKYQVSLKTLMSVPLDTQLNLSGNLDFNPVSFSMDSLMEVAALQRSEVKLSKDQEEILKRQVEATGYNDMPAVNLAASYGFKNGFEPNLDVIRGNWNAGIFINYPIFNGSRKEYQKEEAVANYESAAAHTNEILQNIRMDVQKALSDLKNTQKQYENVNVQVEQAEKSLEKAELQYKSGTINNLEVLDAQTQLAEAKLSRLQITYRHLLNLYALKRAVGDIIW